MRTMIGIMATVLALTASGQARERPEKFERLLVALTASAHCDLELQLPLATKYYSSFNIPVSKAPEDELQLIAAVMAYAQISEAAWDSKPEKARRCANMVRWFGAEGTEMRGMMTGTGKPNE